MHIKQALLAIISPPDAINPNTSPVTVEELTKELTVAAKKQAHYAEIVENSTSDELYWRHSLSLTFWKCVVNLLKAAILCGPEQLPEIPLPELEGLVTMDRMAEVEKFGFRVLQAAEAKGGVHA